MKAALAHAPLMIDVAGHGLTDVDRRRLQHPLVGGVILFTRNWADREQLLNLCSDIKSLRADLIVAVDHEGGRVQRFRTDGYTVLPSMRRLGQWWMHAPMDALRGANALGYILGSELRACGIDMSFAPVLDLDHGPSSVIGDRSFHRDPRVVTVLAQAVITGLQRAGLAHCGKHFPGHGYVAADSHVAIPVDKRGIKAILADDARPYAWLSNALDAVMPAHVIYPKVDPRPAGFSSTWLKTVLRERLGFAGLVVSDDLSMQGARQVQGQSLSPVQAVCAALNAGCDLALMCNQSLDGGAVLDELLDELAQAHDAGVWVADEDSEVRRLSLLPERTPLNWSSLMMDARYEAALSCLSECP